MSAVSSSGSEPFVLARRGLPFPASARLLAPARWFASFAFGRSRRVLPPAAAQALPGMEPAAGLPGETEEDPYENLPAGDERLPASETAPPHASPRSPDRTPSAGARASEIPARVEPKTQVVHIVAQRPQAVISARPAEADSNHPPSAKSAQPARRVAQAIPRLSLDQAPPQASSAAGLPEAQATRGHSRAPLGVTPSMPPSPGAGVDGALGQRPPPAPLPVPEAGASRTATTPSVSGNVPAPQKIAAPVAASAPASFATLMGTAHAAPSSASGAAASRTQIAQLAERSRATLAANAAGHATHRIGTVQVVVQSNAPAARAAPATPRVQEPGRTSSARRPVRREFRNPWASARRRSD